MPVDGMPAGGVPFRCAASGPAIRAQALFMRSLPLERAAGDSVDAVAFSGVRAIGQQRHSGDWTDPRHR